MFRNSKELFRMEKSLIKNLYTNFFGLFLRYKIKENVEDSRYIIRYSHPSLISLLSRAQVIFPKDRETKHLGQGESIRDDRNSDPLKLLSARPPESFNSRNFIEK